MPETTTSLFVERLQSLRDRQGLNNLQLAKAVGLSHVSIGNFLNGQLPKSEHLVSLADFFDVTTDWLLGLDPKPPAPGRRPRADNPLVTDALAGVRDAREKLKSLERKLRRL
jgi:transcriptional regulator with XRE-family HTH domain